jgi:hypothetical protein
MCEVSTISMRFYLLEVPYPHGYYRIILFTLIIVFKTNNRVIFFFFFSLFVNFSFLRRSFHQLNGSITLLSFDLH